MEDGLLRGGIAVLDFGGQYSHLICRRVRALGVYAALLPFETVFERLEELGVAGVILSGGPASVYQDGAPSPDDRIFTGGIPVLGICYGYQLMVRASGGEVLRAPKREYGRSTLRIEERSGIFAGIEKPSLDCWMSHGDSPARLPGGFVVIATSDNSPFAASRSSSGLQYGVQFHPEVVQTEDGQKILSNFVLGISHAQKQWSMGDFLDRKVDELRRTVSGRVLCAVSGGVDSSVTAVLLTKAVGTRLQCVFIDNGLLREGEAAKVSETLGRDLGVPIAVVDASQRFFSGLRGVENPEEKRRTIGKIFGEVFEGFARDNGPFEYLAQGTLYPDVIESGRSTAPASIIKTHHNVGGLPGDLSMKVVEPLRELYKDEVRVLGTILGLPSSIVARHPFPGPGLGVRVIGEVTPEKLRVCRESNNIVETVLVEEGIYEKVWQGFAYVGDDKVTGVLGDERRVGFQVTVKVVESQDAMTADWYRMPPLVLEKISSRITNEVEGVVSVVYSVSSKPPATIEPQ